MVRSEALSHKPIRIMALAGVFLAMLIQAPVPGALSAQDPSNARFRVSYPASAHEGPVTGRVFVMISRTDEREPRLQIGRDGMPFFGRDIEAMAPGAAASHRRHRPGLPTREPHGAARPATISYRGWSMSIPSSRRADGHVVWMHNDQWEGQAFQRSPGNLYSDVIRVHLDPAEGFDIELVARNVIPPIPFPQDTEWVKRFRFQSPTLSEFWGEPIFIGATVLLPRDYEGSTISYPVLYKQGHFSSWRPTRIPGRFGNSRRVDQRRLPEDDGGDLSAPHALFR